MQHRGREGERAGASNLHEETPHCNVCIGDGPRGTSNELGGRRGVGAGAGEETAAGRNSCHATQPQPDSPRRSNFPPLTLYYADISTALGLSQS